MSRDAKLLALAGLVAAGAVVAGVLAGGSSTSSPDARTADATGRQGPSQSKRDGKSAAARRVARRRELPTIPDLIDLPLEDAREALASRDIPLKLIGDDNDCRDLAPGGKVVDQSPRPGRRVDRRAWLWVEVAVTCSDTVAAATCRPNDLSLEARGYEGWHAGSGGTKVANFRLKNEGEYACQLDSTALVTLTDSATGQSEPVRGNPATLLVDWMLRRGAVLDVEWDWRNWCQEKGKALVVVELAGLSDTDGVPTPLLCDHPKLASTVTGPNLYGP
jgi:hypothetical protein